MTRFAARARTAFIARCTATITAVTTILAASLTGLPLAAASPAVPLDPNSSDVAPQWVNPAIRPGEGERAQLSLLDARLPPMAASSNSSCASPTCRRIH